MQSAMSRSWWVFGLGLVLLGCRAHAEFEPLSPPPRALSPVSAETVQVVRAPATPPGVNIGRISVSTRPHVHDEPREEDTLALIRNIGGEHGCELLVVAPARTELYATSNGTPLYETYQAALCYVKP